MKEVATLTGGELYVAAVRLFEEAGQYRRSDPERHDQLLRQAEWNQRQSRLRLDAAALLAADPGLPRAVAGMLDKERASWHAVLQVEA